MTTTTPTLTDWLELQIAADERIARTALEPDPVFDEPRSFYTSPGPHRDDWGMWTLHVDPARVLAECAAKRAIVQAAESYWPELEHGDNGEWAFDLTLRALASVYRDRDGWQEEWA